MLPLPLPFALPEEPPVTAAALVADVVRANLEPSYVAYGHGYGLDPLIFEANVAPHFSLFPRGWQAALFLTPKILLRMFAEESQPVWTPSYMPRLTLVAWLTERLEGPTFYGSLTLSHHSNGQAGPFFNPDGSVNHEDGDFSTNYLEPSLAMVMHEGRFFGWNAVALEWHPGFNQNDELEGRYGFWRVHYAATLVTRLFWEGKIQLRVSAIVDDVQRPSNAPSVGALRRFPVQVRYIGRIPGLEVGIFAAGYAGQDYYNIWFDRMVAMGLIGFSGDFSTTLPSE
jgi:hypothetical protein